ncbi:MAG: ABC transporter permease [Anaerolineaceae bacterium]|nr:MAG: ABC transporter permease [Anaerolineaceae bacterium]
MQRRIDKIFKSKSFSAFTSALLAIFLGLIIGFIVMLIAKPEKASAAFQKILLYGFSDLGNVFYFATPIMMTGLAVGFAFKMGLFNIGASGQYTAGMFCAMYVALMFDLPDGIHWIACILAGMIGGMLWGMIPGIFKAYLNVNEVITSIMFNYIGMYLVDMLIKGNAKMFISSTSRSAYLPGSAQLPSLGVKNSSVNISIFIAIALAILLFILLNKTVFGYELKATGYNRHASKYAGMNGTRNIILTMMIAGAMAGLGGAFAILAPSTITGSSQTYEPINVIAANGFNGIAVALLGNSSPLGVIFSSVFISHIQRGGSQTSILGFKPEIIDVVISTIIYFSAFSLIMKSGIGRFFKNIHHRKPNARTVSETPVHGSTLIADEPSEAELIQEDELKEAVDIPDYIENTQDSEEEV